MSEVKKTLPTWILVVSALFAIMEIMVSFAIYFSPLSVVETADLSANGVQFLFYMWSVRQFALGIILGFATIKRSIPMLTIAYIFLLVMFAGDGLTGVLQKDNSLIIAALVMCIISVAMLFGLNKK